MHLYGIRQIRQQRWKKGIWVTRSKRKLEKYIKVNLVQRKSVRHLNIGHSICHCVHHVDIY